ncbi:MAG: hypothetical protein ACT4O9_02150 [Blastocatellia bacterium]
MISTLFKEQRPLMVTGSVFLIGFVFLVLLSLIDTTEILGINRWIKPLKFFISTVIFLWTVAIYLHYLPGYRLLKHFVSWALVVIFVVENSILVIQAARGTTSHFNNSTPFDAILFSTMGLFIAVNTLLIAVILFLYLRAKIDQPKAIVWGMRLGLIVFLLGSAQGGYMSAQTGHGVGVADGGAGLPLVNWSTVGGDLRIAHFLGLHALQAVPLFALAVERMRPSVSTLGTVAFAIAYFVLFTFLFVQALMGKPLIAGI